MHGRCVQIRKHNEVEAGAWPETTSVTASGALLLRRIRCEEEEREVVGRGGKLSAEEKEPGRGKGNDQDRKTEGE